MFFGFFSGFFRLYCEVSIPSCLMHPFLSLCDGRLCCALHFGHCPLDACLRAMLVPCWLVWLPEGMLCGVSVCHVMLFLLLFVCFTPFLFPLLLFVFVYFCFCFVLCVCVDCYGVVMYFLSVVTVCWGKRC